MTAPAPQWPQVGDKVWFIAGEDIRVGAGARGYLS
jgi:hypothetical protein